MNEKLYLFNPFNIKKWENEQIKEQLDVLISNYDHEADTLHRYALNVENIANQLYLIGEMTARLCEMVNVMKADVSNKENLQVYKQRDAYEKTHDGKPPAMSYFQALASEFVSEERKQLARKESDLTRFKIAYKSLEAMMNAQKKKMEAVRYEEFGG